MIPEALTGGWRRRSLRVGGGEPGETATVVWLQAGHHYADLRIPLPDDGALPDPTDPRAASFAGTTHWLAPDRPGEPGRLRWRHDLDLRGDAGDDIGTVRFEGPDLVEDGVPVQPGDPVPYTEVWGRLPHSLGTRLVLGTGSGNGTLVRVGAHAITIIDGRAGGGTYRGVHRALLDGAWVPRSAYGVGADVLPAPPGGAPAEGDELVLAGEPWVVLEASGPAPA